MHIRKLGVETAVLSLMIYVVILWQCCTWTVAPAVEAETKRYMGQMLKSQQTSTGFSWITYVQGPRPEGNAARCPAQQFSLWFIW